MFPNKNEEQRIGRDFGFISSADKKLFFDVNKIFTIQG